MRIVEEENIAPEEMPAAALPRWPAEEFVAQKNKPRQPEQRRQRHSFAKFVLAFIFMLALIAVSLGYLIFFIAGPLVKAVDAVPADFPRDLAIYELEQAQIKLQLPQYRQRLSQLIKGLPAWTLEPFTGYLTTDLKTQITAGLKDPNLLSDNLTINDLGNTLSGDQNRIKTVGLEWDNISKTKEDVFDYYKEQLIKSGFSTKEKIGDYEIDLSFFKPGIDGAMSIADSFMTDNNSVIRMTINYLSQN